MAEAEAPGTETVAGVEVDRSLAAPPTDRPRVAVVAPRWGSNWGERAVAIRLVAGALALSSEIVVVSLEDEGEEAAGDLGAGYDGIFRVHAVRSRSPQPGLSDVLLASLACSGRPSGRPLLPEMAASRLVRLDSRFSDEAIALLGELEPQAVVLGGVETLWAAPALRALPSAPRIVVLPLLGDDPRLRSGEVARLDESAHAVCAFSEAEEQHLVHSVGARDRSVLHHLRLSFPVNVQAASAGLAGMASFGRYVLVISGLPDDDPATHGKGPAHDYVRAAVGDVSVAEVRPGRWLVSEFGRHFEVPWSTSRMNLWRLMAGAVATVDVRKQGPIGRETLESMAYGTPVVVPAGSVAAEHARVANGGLWYRAPGEMMDCLRFFVDEPEARDAFGARGRAWVEQEHGDTERLVGELTKVAAG